MHEYSIVSSLLEQCQQYVLENRAKGVARVIVKVGELSGVEPALLQTAFDTFKEEGACHCAELELQLQPLTLFCSDCNQNSEPGNRTVVCPQCGSFNTRVTDGEDLYLMQLELLT
ncbi:MAG: hydrogenase maturation nickel metallochaperone HypA [Shewanella sp.]|nr:hydrogenase maturation nickel metallochaperone HypA [Shewanella sp.]MCF1429657.1 hydrogenase maturation nickel metallochaperone HypA [Shewanella sp.]MCF1437411.1 hydrogenase maturation nickel metallochaperone HypA [Shewanella sp.]MCF1456291.1 hydrogenase maturation nickel metallochaperone HypA [Shewanella sp.]